MKIAFVGCGYVADLYAQTMKLHPELNLIGVYDRDAERLSAYAKYYDFEILPDLQSVLNSDAELVINLTNPESHYDVSKAVLEAGKHVYSEKPLAIEFAQAEQLVDLANSKGLLICSAPCNILGESAMTLSKAVKDEVLGKVYAVYAEMDDGLVHRMPYRKWFSESGAPWPAKDEFEVGCTLEHAGYVLTWLCDMFGPVSHLTAFGTTAIADKQTDVPLERDSPDLTVACMNFEAGITARLTCSIVGAHDHRVRVFCENGILGTNDTWNYRSPIWRKDYISIRRKSLLSPWKRRLPFVRTPGSLVQYGGSSLMDFCRGPAEMVASLSERRPCRLAPEFCLHVNELALAIGSATEAGMTFVPTTRFLI